MAAGLSQGPEDSRRGHLGLLTEALAADEPGTWPPEGYQLPPGYQKRHFGLWSSAMELDVKGGEGARAGAGPC